jgi:predicted Zn-dependent protease
LKSSRDFTPRKFARRAKLGICAAIVAVIAAGLALTAKGELPGWIRNIEAKTEVERAFFRAMALPYGDVLYRRPPAETRPELGTLIQKSPNAAELYSLRALEDEHQLDFAAAEKDWKLYAEKAGNKPAAKLELADFYHRRLRTQDEIAILRAVADAPPDASERFTPATEQRSWSAFERIFGVIQAQGLLKDVSLANYKAWTARYTKEEQLYSRFLNYLVDQNEFAAANQLIADYQKQFPGDAIFPVKGKALVEYRQGSVQQGLSVYEKTFQPLWDPELVKSYFDLLGQTQNLRKFLDEARAALNANPEDLKATARVFYYYQQQGKLDAAQQAITSLRLHKEAAKSAWTPNELYICGRLLEDIHAYPEAARYYFALYNSMGSNAAGAKDAQEKALSRLTDILLTTPEAPIRLGTGELSLYKDIATLDQGPGYLNGILSLILNSTSPESEYPAEEQRAVPYFHRARAAELLALLDKNFPESANRPELHAKLLEYYANSGKSEIMLQSGQDFLVAFPKASQRTQVALLMADADARLKRTREEFAIYDAVLQELAAHSDGMPLGVRVAGVEKFSPMRRPGTEKNEPTEGEEGEGAQASHAANVNDGQQSAAFQVRKEEGARESGPRSPEYSRVLERYLARLVELKEVPQALGVLRREIDHNPNDPGLYERLAVFLEQNHLGQEQEEVYRRATARFPDRSWYSKLARYYLRYKKNAELEQLTQNAVKQFDGTELESYFQSVGGSTRAMYVRLNQYANARFPHNPYFVRNLLNAYHSKPAYDQAAWLALIRQHWFEEPDLRNEYFEYLSSSGQLEKELSALRETAPANQNGEWDAYVHKNPAAGREVAEVEIWRSHFEQSAPVLKALAAEYPAEPELDRTASSVFRSLAYFDPANTQIAAKIEENLSAVNPGDTEILSRVGDIYADRELFAEAAPYWERIPRVAPGESGGYLEAATIYWDYFDFENALRLLNEGRNRLGNATLYGYEEGAIFEGKRDYVSAIREYTRTALAENEASPAFGRLLELARRPKYRDLVNEETEKLANASPDSLAAINLRVRVLDAENRKPELIAFLNAAVDRAKSMEQAAQIEPIAQQRSLEEVRQRALEKQAALAVDPVTRLQLRYQLVRLYESRKDFAAAQRNIEGLYRENPKILGVVRATVDFYWRMKSYPQAIAVLLQAAKDAYPQLGRQFRFEAARKSTEAKEFQQARTLLEGLLKDSPYNSEYLAAVADTYAQAGDAQGLKQFYLDKIAAFRTAPFTGDERKTRIAALRRGLIPALTQLKEYAGAVDQYIELLNNFPEDEGLATEAALYGLRFQREKQLLDFYTKTVQQSPRDFRWPMVLARIQTNLESFPAAIESYGKSIVIRPDRTDLRIARVTLEERLLQFDDAASDYERLYELSYKDPKWMEKVAEVRARQGRNADAVAALKMALIDVEPARASNYFEVAHRLEGWGILEQAREFAEQGVQIAGSDLLANTENHDGARLYARIMTRLRQHEKGYRTLRDALKAASDSLPVVKQQVAREGIAAVSDREWREHTLTIRKANAANGMRSAMTEMGTVAGRYFTPEERVSFGAFAQTVHDSPNPMVTDNLAFSLAHAAGLAEIEARWRYELMMSLPADDIEPTNQMGQLVQLQRQRLKFVELGQQLEKFVSRVRPEEYGSVNQAAAEEYRAAGDEQKELELLSNLSPGYLDPSNQTRFLQLMLKLRPQQLARIASEWTPFGQTAADYVVLNGNAELAQAVVTGRSHARPVVWQKSYTALVGLYFGETRPAVNEAFTGALGNQTIGDRLGKPVDLHQQLAGDVWFYYGSRYGEYLGDTKLGPAEDFLPATLEQSPASKGGYQSLGDYYFGKGDTRRAIEQFNYTLQLSPGIASVHDKLALAYFQEGNRAQAVAEWKQVFSTLLAELNKSGMNETFWADFGRACDHSQKRHLFADVQPKVDQVLRAYLHRNGNYRSNALLHSAYIAQADPTAATGWLLEIASDAPDPVNVLADVVEASWMPLPQRGPIYLGILAAKKLAMERSEGIEKEIETSALRDWQLRWVKYQVETKQFSQAQDAIAALRQDTWKQEAAALVPYEMQVAAQLGTLDAKLAGYTAEPQTAPSADALRTGARQLFEAGDKQSARKTLEFVFARELQEHQLVAANFLGLAEIRIAAGDTPRAVSLLKRLVLVVGDRYQNMDSAAALLEKTGHAAEAIEFLEPLAKSTLWEPNYQLRLAKAQTASAQNKSGAQVSLVKIAADGSGLYSTRVQAAEALDGGSPAKNLGSAELNLLASGVKTITPSSADQPLFYDSRLAAAQNSSDANVKMQILGKALADTPSREDARLPFFRAAESLRLDETALASIEQLLRDQRLRQIVPNATYREEEIVSDDEGSTVDDQEIPITPSPKMQQDQQAQTARAVGNALTRLQRLDEAIGYLQVAQKLEKAPAVKKAITAELWKVQARLRREKLNAARQPILHEELEQNRLVRPRLVARAIRPAKPDGKPDAKKGEQP